MIAADVAAALGSLYRSGSWWRCPCPVHGSRGGTLALRDGDRGLVVYCHAACDRGEILAELRRRGLLRSRGRPQSGHACQDDLWQADDARRAANYRRDVDEADRRRRITEALDIWNESYPDTLTGLVGRYLGSRGIFLPLPPTIRVHGALGPYGRHPQSGERRPQMVALVEHVEYGPVGVSRTFLAIDGSGKASLDPPRLFHGPVKGAAVRLAPATDTLMVGEGIETCLAAMQATALPAWAALSAIGLERLIIPAAVRDVLIAVDRDATGTGERAARAAAARWLAEGRRVRLVIPHVIGADLAELIGEAYDAA
jgi:hypothetical protein